MVQNEGSEVTDTNQETRRCPTCNASVASGFHGAAVVYTCGTREDAACGVTLDSHASAGRELIEYYEEAIRKHRDQRGDDRCWQDDEELYSILPEGYTPPPRDTAVMLEQCEKYIACRQNPATTYISPQRRIEELETELIQYRVASLMEQGKLAAEKERLVSALNKLDIKLSELNKKLDDSITRRDT